MDNNSVLGLLHRVDVGDVADASEVHASSIFRIEVCSLVSLCIYRGAQKMYTHFNLQNICVKNVIAKFIHTPRDDCETLLTTTITESAQSVHH
jgi:hypothetical protein